MREGTRRNAVMHCTGFMRLHMRIIRWVESVSGSILVDYKQICTGQLSAASASSGVVTVQLLEEYPTPTTIQNVTLNCMLF